VSKSNPDVLLLEAEIATIVLAQIPYRNCVYICLSSDLE
jgi:hypothetical protein